VVLGRAGFAVLAEHTGACHLRLIAPFEWRARRHAAETLTPIEAARQAVLHDDHQRCVYAKRLYGKDLDEMANFTVVCDASRLTRSAIVEIALAAAGVTPKVLDPR
jgi:cytidylate kinase